MNGIETLANSIRAPGDPEVPGDALGPLTSVADYCDGSGFVIGDKREREREIAP